MSEPVETQFKYAVALWRSGHNTLQIAEKLSRGRDFEPTVYRWINWHLDSKSEKKGIL